MRRCLVAVPLAVCALVLAGSAASGTVPHWKAWLCFPGTSTDWCSVDLATTVISADGSRKTVGVSVPQNPPIDCFYVYPTVSVEPRPNSDLKLQSEERQIGIAQAARFSHVCRVYAPLYQQVTAGAGQCAPGGLVCNPKGNKTLAYHDVLAAWSDYLAHYNDGRGVVLLGHSQGAHILAKLIQQQIETSPSERKLLVSAILLGGDITVKDGSTEGGTFRNVPACTSSTETGCVIAYSSWNRPPPKDASAQDVPDGSEHVLCVNPAAPAGGSASITPIFAGINPEGVAPYPSIYTTYHWVEFPHLYTARCVQEGTRAWLLVSRITTPGDHRPTAQGTVGAKNGLHAADVNITLANLVTLVANQSNAWLAHK
jgi:hypothetical protein